jgi:hypothetical protein
MIRKLIFPSLVLTIGIVLFFTIRGAIGDPASRTANMAAIVSSVSALTAIVVAYWSEHRERRHREALEVKSTDQQRKSKERLAALYASEITAWLNRKDLQDTISGLDIIETEEAIDKCLKAIFINQKLKNQEALELNADSVTPSQLWSKQTRYLNP